MRSSSQKEEEKGMVLDGGSGEKQAIGSQLAKKSMDDHFDVNKLFVPSPFSLFHFFFLVFFPPFCYQAMAKVYPKFLKKI